MSGGNCALIGGVMPCSSCGRSRGGGPRSPMSTLAWIVTSPDGVVTVRASRAQAARDVRNGNRNVPSDLIGPGYRWSYRVEWVPLDGSSPLEAALRTGVCAGCQNGRSPVQASEGDE